MKIKIVLLTVLLLAFSSVGFAQSRVVINKSLIPAEADDLSKFVPAGWKLEQQVKGDLNGDSTPDYALKLVEDKPDKDKDGSLIERQRALVIVLQKENGKFARAAVADRLLQCTTCQGISGVSEHDADVTIDKGVLVVDQDHGSNTTGHLTYRFRYDAGTNKFLLIGFDYVFNSRIEENTVTESTNYLTGLRIVKHFTNKGEKTSKLEISKSKISLEDVDDDKFEEATTTRLHV